MHVRFTKIVDRFLLGPEIPPRYRPPGCTIHSRCHTVAIGIQPARETNVCCTFQLARAIGLSKHCLIQSGLGTL